MPKDNHRRNKLEPMHQFGVFVGTVPRTGEFVVLTPEGAVPVRTVHRLSEKTEKVGCRIHVPGGRYSVGFQLQRRWRNWGRRHSTKNRFTSLANMLDSCIERLTPLVASKKKKYKGQVVLRGDIVKNDSGSYAVVTEQGSSASQMTAAKVMDIISRLPGCSGQAADAVSAFPQVNMEDAPTFLKIPNSVCPDIWIRLPKHKWPKSWSSMEDPVVLLERKLYGHLLAGLLWERQFEKILLKYVWEKVSNWECFFVHREKGLFLSVYVDDVKLAGKKQNIDPIWKVLNKEVVLGRTNIFPWSCILVVHSTTMPNKQRYCGQLQEHVRIQNFRRSNWKITMLGKYAYLFVVLQYGRSCPEMCGATLWVGQ